MAARSSVRFSRILVGLDGGKPSSWALDWAIALAKSSRAKLLLACVGPPPHLEEHSHAADRAYMSRAFDEAHDDPEKPLADAAERCRKARVRCTLHLRRGSPSHELIRLARTERADLVVLGHHGHGRLHRALLGSVTERMKNHIAASLFIAKGPPRFQRALVATDGSTRARRAVGVAMALRRTHRSALLVQFVYGRSTLALADEARHQFNRILNDLGLARPPRGIRTVLEFGSPARRIVHRAQAQDVGLIIVGNRGHGAVRSHLLGSTSSSVAHAAATSVLIVKS